MKPDLDAKRPDFEKAQTAATELLLKQDLTSLSIDARHFKFEKRIIIDSVQHYACIVGRPVSDFTCDRFSGCCLLKYPRCNIILFDDVETNDFRKHWGIIHEIGHLYLDHEKDGDVEEIEANFFAAQIVMPEIVLHNVSARIEGLSPFDISGVFNASLDAAAKRIDTFQRRYRFNCDNRDKELLRRLKPFIEEAYPTDVENAFWTKIMA